MSLNSIFQYFVPKDKKIFFPLFEQSAGNLVKMADILITAVNTPDAVQRGELFNQIDKLENFGDELTHSIYQELTRNFITPFDREDIAALANTMDDVADYMQTAVNQMSLYQMNNMSKPIRQLAELIKQGCTQVEKAVIMLKDLKDVEKIAEICVKINKLESQADDVFDRGVADLFLYEREAVSLIKQKEVLASLETATDRCEDVANVIETILIKNA